jgi:hypothetical protein
MVAVLADTIRFDIPFQKSFVGNPGTYAVRGVTSTQSRDQQGENIWQNGIDLGPLRRSGWIDWNHKGDTQPAALIGRPTHAEITTLGKVDGYVMKSGQSKSDPCMYFEGRLLKGVPSAEAAWTLLGALKKAVEDGELPPGNLGWSVQGGIVERRGTQIIKSVVRHMALTHEPVNDETVAWMKSLRTTGMANYTENGEGITHFDSLETFAKSFAKAGVGEATNAQTIAGISPLLLENLAGGPAAEKARKRALGLDNACAPGMTCHNGTTYKSGGRSMYDHLTKCIGMQQADALDHIGGLLKAMGARLG